MLAIAAVIFQISQRIYPSGLSPTSSNRILFEFNRSLNILRVFMISDNAIGQGLGGQILIILC